MKTLDDIKIECLSRYKLGTSPQLNQFTEDVICSTIDHLHAKGLLMVWNTDMDSAPRDGTEFLAYCPSAVKRKYHICHFWHSDGDAYRWEDSRCHRIEPIAWMPLPKGGE